MTLTHLKCVVQISWIHFDFDNEHDKDSLSFAIQNRLLVAPGVARFMHYYGCGCQGHLASQGGKAVSQKIRIRRGVNPTGQRFMQNGGGFAERSLVSAETEKDVVALLAEVWAVDWFERANLLTLHVKAALVLPREERQYRMQVMLTACQRGKLLLEFGEVAARLGI